MLNCLTSILKLKPCHWFIIAHIDHTPYPVSKAAGGLQGVKAAPSWSIAPPPEISQLSAYFLYCLDLTTTLPLSTQFWDGLWHSDTHPNLFLPKVRVPMAFWKWSCSYFPNLGMSKQTSHFLENTGSHPALPVVMLKWLTSISSIPEFCERYF